MFPALKDTGGRLQFEHFPSEKRNVVSPSVCLVHPYALERWGIQQRGRGEGVRMVWYHALGCCNGAKVTWCQKKWLMR